MRYFTRETIFLDFDSQNINQNQSINTFDIS